MLQYENINILLLYPFNQKNENQIFCIDKTSSFIKNKLHINYKYFRNKNECIEKIDI